MYNVLEHSIFMHRVQLMFLYNYVILFKNADNIQYIFIIVNSLVLQ